MEGCITVQGIADREPVDREDRIEGAKCVGLPR